MASEFCKKERVLINNLPVKPSREVSVGETIEIKFPPIIRTFIVTGIIEKRVSASIASQNVQETTQESEFEKLKLANANPLKREKGEGRPTKKDRRDLDNLKNY